MPEDRKPAPSPETEHAQPQDKPDKGDLKDQHPSPDEGLQPQKEPLK